MKRNAASGLFTRSPKLILTCFSADASNYAVRLVFGRHIVYIKYVNEDGCVVEATIKNARFLMAGTFNSTKLLGGKK